MFNGNVLFTLKLPKGGRYYIFSFFINYNFELNALNGCEDRDGK